MTASPSAFSTPFNTSTQWGWVAKTFHWLIFLLMLAAWFAVESHEYFPKGSPERAFRMMLHKSFGASVFFLVWLRLYWRLSQPHPAPEPAPRWQLLAAAVVHWGLYFVMVALPLTGMLASQFGGRVVSWFGLFDIPVLLAPDKAFAGQLMGLHKDLLWPLLLVLLAGHVGAALWHHVITRDRTLRRMLPFLD
ncbi:MAG TPA: cytochrome b [Moraxellaceae bacterium]